MYEVEIPLVVGLVGVGIAILERGWKTFLEAKKLEPDLKFDSAYLLNLLVSTGFGTVIVTTVIPALLIALQQTTQENLYVGLAAILVNFGLGYGLTFRTLDAMNKSTEKKIEIAELRETVAKTTMAASTSTTTNTTAK